MIYVFFFFFFFFCLKKKRKVGYIVKGKPGLCLFSMLSLRGKAGSTTLQRRLTYKKL
jgi:hypothetical protein